MKILNVRLGFATNSSSSHSVILNSSFEKDWDTDGYGWNQFLLKSKKSKTHYMASQLYCNLCNIGFTEHFSKYIAESLFKTTDVIDIDHQSVFCIPGVHRGARFCYESEGKLNYEPDLEFFNELSDYILKNPSLHISGGNDNDDAYDYGGTVDELIAKIPKDGNICVCRKDGNYWVLFNLYSGNKIRLSFDKNPGEFKSVSPELVDLKITNFCPYGCDFCYQSSTIKGEHATLDHIRDIIGTLSEAKTFEIALGGGEPTLHPYFIDILKEIHIHHIVPNFTTFSLDWINKPEILEAVKKYCGGFALSVNNKDRMKNWSKLKKLEEVYKNFNRTEVIIQSILGVVEDNVLLKLIEDMSCMKLYRLTLLGYKSFGRGEDISPKINNLSAILDHCKKYNIRLSLDTVAINQYKEILDKHDVNPILYTASEGTHSCYIDAIKNFVAKDSYTNETFKFNNNLEKVLVNVYPFRG